MRVIVAGAGGRLGSAVCKLDWSGHDVVSWTRSDAELSDYDEVLAAFDEEWTRGGVWSSGGVSAVVNCAGFADVVACETQRERAWRDNFLSALNLAKACLRNHVKLVQVSTLAVLGEHVDPAPVGAPLEPLNYYSTTKALAEAAVMTLPVWAIVRAYVLEPSWTHPVAVNGLRTVTSRAELAEFIQRVTLRRCGMQHFGVRTVNLLDYARSFNPNVGEADPSHLVAPIARNTVCATQRTAAQEH